MADLMAIPILSQKQSPILNYTSTYASADGYVNKVVEPFRSSKSVFAQSRRGAVVDQTSSHTELLLDRFRERYMLERQVGGMNQSSFFHIERSCRRYSQASYDPNVKTTLAAKETRESNYLFAYCVRIGYVNFLPRSSNEVPFCVR